MKLFKGNRYHITQRDTHRHRRNAMNLRGGEAVQLLKDLLALFNASKKDGLRMSGGLCEDIAGEIQRVLPRERK